jgi:hypothetical protein
MLREYHAHLVALNPAAAAYTYEMLLDDYTLAFCFWWTALITIGVGTVPAFERPEGARMRQLWTRGLQRAFVAMGELEKGAIANPDEGRMVGHYWLRDPGLAPNSFLRTKIENTVDHILAFSQDVVSGKVSSAQFVVLYYLFPRTVYCYSKGGGV